MNKYLLIFRDHENQWSKFSAAQMQEVSEKFDVWRETLKQDNAFIGAGKLTEGLGRTVRKNNQDFVVDGPFSEVKEAIAGYYCINAENIDAAIDQAKKFPMLEYGGSVEVREMFLVVSE